ncbi:MAG: peptidase, partial [Naasia sp.]|nr:peptidase [Naasia sp.]
MDPVELAQRLVAVPSVSGTSGQSDVLELLAETLSRTFALRRAESAGRLVALAALPYTVDRPLLLFTGHVDVVPVSDESRWARPPFSARLEEGRLWGRGASDMKAGIAGFVSALLSQADSHPKGAAGALFTTDEETGCQGALAAAALVTELPVALFVVAEPTDAVPFRGHKGVTWVRVRTEGVAAHGSTPELGVSAIRRLADLTRRAEALESPEWDTMNVGLISGGSAPNIVPVEAEATIDMRSSRVGVDLASWWREQPE